jgi:hypothetical protein
MRKLIQLGTAAAYEPDSEPTGGITQKRVGQPEWLSKYIYVVDEIWSMPGCPDTAIRVCYNKSHQYVGDEDTGRYLAQRGIAPELNDPQHSVCSIGYCEKDGKWYGWSHRAMYGYKVGDPASKGDAMVQHDRITTDTYAKDCARRFAESVSRVSRAQ